MVIENVGEATWEISEKACVGGGRIVVCGATSGTRPPIDLQRLFIRQLSVIGVTIGNFEEFRTLIDALDRKLFEPVFDSVIGLEDVPDGLRRLDSGQQTGKIGVRIERSIE